MLQCAPVCCSACAYSTILERDCCQVRHICVAVFSSVLQYVAACVYLDTTLAPHCRPVRHTCVAVCCSVLQHVAASMLRYNVKARLTSGTTHMCCSVLQHVAVCCSMLQPVCLDTIFDRVCVTTHMCCSVLQCVAVCYNVLQSVAVKALLYIRVAY